MATIHELLKRISDDGLRTSLEKEVQRLTSQKKFGLVFEEHLPEATPLYGMKIRVGMTVVTAAQDGGALFTVKSIVGDVATCVPFHDEKGDEQQFPLDELVAVAKFGDPIYPVLEPIDKIEHGGGDLWHTLIQADNYHALQLLEYLYAGKVDCMYIDPPYNTGARDWKYNNDYVDKDDAWRHSKWLSMMKKRLVIAKRLLNPKDSVLIVTIDEKEYLHLGMLLEEMFPEARIQMVSTIIKPEGTQRRNEFSRTNEFIYFVMFGNQIVPTYTSSLFEERTDEDEDDVDDDESDSQDGEGDAYEIKWSNLRRRNRANVRASRPNQFYPIFVNKETGAIVSIGDALRPEESRFDVKVPSSCYAVFPLATDGREMLWGKHYKTAKSLFELGFLKTDKGLDPEKVRIMYLPEGIEKAIKAGRIVITGRGDQNEVLGHYVDFVKQIAPKTVWNVSSHNAQSGGSLLIKSVIGENRFSFPKSVYAVYDCIKLFTNSKPNALILDFFAGSGTTLHAVNLINAEDGGRRRCIMVTNNEISEAEEKEFRKRGLKPGDDEWEAKGIAQYVTWPRTTCSIKGVNVKGEALKGEYLTAKGGPLGDRPLPMADGFQANCEFFKLGFVNRDAVSLGRQFKEILTLLWMRSGAKGARPVVKRGESDPTMMVLPQNGMAILLKECAFPEFAKKVANDASIGYVYLVTDSEKNYRDMARSFEGKDCVQIYRHYLDNFRINKFAQR